MIYGYTRGLIKEVLSILSIIVSGYFSVILYPDISMSVKKYIDMVLLADSISFAILFLLIYSSINIFTNFIVSSISKTSLKIFDKNFVILLVFRSLLILSLLNILLTWVLWKKNIPSWMNNSKTMLLINYSSSKIIELVPKESLKKIEQTFNISLNKNNIEMFNNKIEKYNEPIIEKNKSIKKQGYSDDNESLDKLFNIESNE